MRAHAFAPCHSGRVAASLLYLRKGVRPHPVVFTTGGVRRATLRDRGEQGGWTGLLRR
jgi:hypothetical protein